MRPRLERHEKWNPRRLATRGGVRVSLSVACLIAAAAAAEPTEPAVTAAAARADLFLVVDCLLPGQVRALGTRTVYVSARRPARLTARDCQIRGGEYVAYDRADQRSALAAWQPLAEQGDLEAQVIVGEIHERGIGVAPDYAAAAIWYRRAAEAGSARAQINLGFLYEQGLGVPADPAAALQWYRKAAGRDGTVELDPALPVPPLEPTVAPPPAPPQASAPPAPTPDPRSAELEARLVRLEAELEAARAALRATEARAAEAVAAEAVARDAYEEARRSMEQGESRAVADLQRELQSRREATAQLQRELQDRQSGTERLQQELSAQRDSAERLARELEAQKRETARLGTELAAVTSVAAGQQQRIAALEASARERLLAGPQLTVVEPDVVPTRDIVPVALAEGAARQVIGRVTAPAGIAAVTVNDATVAVSETGLFSTSVSLRGGDSPVRIVAVDRQGKRDELRFVLRAAATPPVPSAMAPAARARGLAAGVDFGSYHALLIGNNDYRHLPDLASPINDVTELARLLEQRYGFRTTVLVDADRYRILSALNSLRETLTSRDNLLVYFAGHGELDEVNQRGHWLPVDAERDSTANWIPSTAVTDILNIMKAKQVLLVVDSCYAGALTRSASGRLGTGMTDEERLHWYRTMAGKRSRTVLTSGGLAPVMDAGGGRHSVFAKALLEVLAASDDTLDGQRLYREVAARVAYAAAGMRFDQVPEYAPIRHAGHEAGEFFLVPRP